MGFNSFPTFEPYPEGQYTMIYGEELFIEVGTIVDWDEDEVSMSVSNALEGVAEISESDGYVTIYIPSGTTDYNMIGGWQIGLDLNDGKDNILVPIYIIIEDGGEGDSTGSGECRRRLRRILDGDGEAGSGSRRGRDRGAGNEGSGADEGEIS